MDSYCSITRIDSVYSTDRQGEICLVVSVPENQYQIRFDITDEKSDIQRLIDKYGLANRNIHKLEGKPVCVYKEGDEIRISPVSGELPVKSQLNERQVEIFLSDSGAEYSK